VGYETVAPENKYQYNGKELNGDYEIKLMDYGARWYDGAIGRFTTTDRFAEKYYPLSPYGYAAGNPVLFIDINGDSIILNNVGAIIRNDETDNLVFLSNEDGSLKPLGEIGGEIDINEIYYNLLQQNAKEANQIINPLTFRKHVRNKGKWDLKNDMNSIFGLANHTKGKSTVFLFEGEEMEAQDVGNHHFGVVGKAYGWFSEEFMLKQAGEAQMAAGTSKPEWQVYKEERRVDFSRSGNPTMRTERVIQPPYGDDPRDQRWIKAGFQHYKTKLK